MQRDLDSFDIIPNIIVNKQDFPIPVEMEWNKALPFGKKLERIFLSLIQQKYPKAIQIKGRCKYYDIWIPEIKKTLELKGDIKSNETGNLVVEIEHYGKPSGLIITKADYWIFYDFNWIWIETSKLKTIVEDYEPAKFVGRGDTVKKTAYLIPKEIILNQSCMIWRSDG